MILAQGDEAGCQEAEGVFPGIVTACVKHAVDRDTCEGPDPASARQLTGEKVAEAVQALRDGKCEAFRPALPMDVTIKMISMDAAQHAANKPEVQRLDDYTVERRIERHCDVVTWIAAAGLDLPDPSP